VASWLSKALCNRESNTYFECDRKKRQNMTTRGILLI
jgi:hypothetical protein